MYESEGDAYEGGIFVPVRLNMYSKAITMPGLGVQFPLGKHILEMYAQHTHTYSEAPWIN